MLVEAVFPKFLDNLQSIVDSKYIVSVFSESVTASFDFK